MEEIEREKILYIYIKFNFKSYLNIYYILYIYYCVCICMYEILSCYDDECEFINIIVM